MKRNQASNRKKEKASKKAIKAQAKIQKRLQMTEKESSLIEWEKTHKVKI